MGSDQWAPQMTTDDCDRSPTLDSSLTSLLLRSVAIKCDSSQVLVVTEQS